MSSANIRVSNVVSPRGTPASFFANSTSSPLMNNCGPKLQPCHLWTPFWHLSTPVAWEFIFTLAVAFLYMDCSIAMIFDCSGQLSVV